MQYLSKINEVPIWQWLAIGWALGILTAITLVTIRNEGIRGIPGSIVPAITFLLAGGVSIVLGLPPAVSLALTISGAALEAQLVWKERQASRTSKSRYSPPIKVKVRAPEKIHDGKPEPLLLRGRD